MRHLRREVSDWRNQATLEKALSGQHVNDRGLPDRDYLKGFVPGIVAKVKSIIAWLRELEDAACKRRVVI